jgi:hypothetical protein
LLIIFTHVRCSDLEYHSHGQSTSHCTKWMFHLNEIVNMELQCSVSYHTFTFVSYVCHMPRLQQFAQLQCTNACWWHRAVTLPLWKRSYLIYDHECCMHESFSVPFSNNHLHTCEARVRHCIVLSLKKWSSNTGQSSTIKLIIWIIEATHVSTMIPYNMSRTHSFSMGILQGLWRRWRTAWCELVCPINMSYIMQWKGVLSSAHSSL